MAQRAITATTATRRRTPATGSDEGHLERIRRVLRERRRLILLVTLTFAACAALFGSLSEESYDVAATIGVSSLDRTGALVGIPRAPSEADSRTLARRVQNLTSLRSVRVDAARRLRREHPDASGGVIYADAKGPGLVWVGVHHRDADEGAQVAQAIAEAVVARLNADQARTTAELIARLKRERRGLGEASDDFVGQLSRAVVERNLTLLETLQQTERAASVLSPAVPPDRPVFVPDERMAPITTLGLTLALIAAFLLDIFDRRPRDPRRLGAAAGLPLAGLVPRLRDGGEGLVEAFQRLRASVDRLADPAPGVVLVTSAAPAEGKSSVAVGLAEAAARTGRRACLVEADLRRPVLAERLGLDGPGLAGVLGGVELESSLRSVATGGVEVAVLPAGSLPRRPGELLGSERLAGLLDDLRERYDLVVVDSPPLPAAADAVVLARRADLVLVCARPPTTAVDDLEAVVRALRPVDVPAALVVSGVPRSAIWTPGVRETRAARRRHQRWQVA